MTPKTKSRWLWITVAFPRVADLNIGLALLEHLLNSKLAEQGYYCHYTNKTPRIEIKCLTDYDMRKLRSAIKATCCRYHNTPPSSITFKPFAGSEAHALAANVILSLSEHNLLRDDSCLRDVIHWMYNMAGFTYAQELESNLRQAHDKLRILVSDQWVDNPMFQHPKYSKPK